MKRLRDDGLEKASFKLEWRWGHFKHFETCVVYQSEKGLAVDKVWTRLKRTSATILDKSGAEKCNEIKDE